MEDFFDESVEQEGRVDFKRYFIGIVKRWWLVLGVAAVVIVPWLLYVKSKPPVYEVEVWVSFENAGGPVPSSLLESRRRKLKSRTFATEVVAKLGLTLTNLEIDGMPDYARTKVLSLIEKNG